MAGGGPTEAGGAIYSRLYNPTVGRFEDGLAALEGAEASVAFASGMAALTAVVLAAKAEGRAHVVGVRPDLRDDGPAALVRPARHGGDLDRRGRRGRRDPARHVPGDDRDARQPDARPGRHRRGGRGRPATCRSRSTRRSRRRSSSSPLALGAALVMHSATKFIGGHGDVLAGVVACSEAWAGRLRQVRILTGADAPPPGGLPAPPGAGDAPAPGPPVGGDRDGAGGPPRRPPGRGRGLPPERGGPRPARPRGHPDERAGPDAVVRGLGARRDAHGPGAFAAADGFLRSLRLATPAVSLGSTDTLAQHPAGLTQRVSTDDAGRGGITAGLVRVSVGLEDADDLWDDLRQAIEAGRAGA